MDYSSPFSRYLNTNYAPSDDEANILRNLIGDHRAQTAALAQKIDDAKRALAALQAQQERHHTFVREHTALLSPIRRVPNEILSLIFLACIEDTWSDQRAPSCISPLNPSNVLSHVSRQWRTLALSTPRLWSSFNFGIPDLTFVGPLESEGESPSDPDDSESDGLAYERKACTRWCKQLKGLCFCFRAWFQRSLPCGIKLVLSSGDVEQPTESDYRANAAQIYESVVDILRETSYRWQEVKLDLYLGPVTRAMVQLFGGSNFDLPQLEKVTINVDDSDPHLPGQDTEVCIQALTASRLFSSPKLRYVRLDGLWGDIARAINGSTAPIYTSVTHLILKAEIIDEEAWIDCEEALELLKLLPQLVALEIDMLQGPDIEVTSDPIILPNLTSMTIRPTPVTLGFGTSLSLPRIDSLRHCSKVYKPFTGDDDSPGQLELLLQCARQLEHLTLCHGSIAQPSLPHFMGELVNLVTLELLAATFKGKHCADSDAFVLSQLSLPGICPRLEELVFQEISNLQEDGLMEWAVVELFAKRRPARRGRLGGTSNEAMQLWCNLRKVELSFRYAQNVVIPVALRSRGVDMDGVGLTVGYP